MCDLQDLRNVNCQEEHNGNRIMNSSDVDSKVMAAADIPLPPSLGPIMTEARVWQHGEVGWAEIRADSEVSIPEIQKNLKKLYEYNMLLRERLVSTRSTIHALTSKSSSDQKHQ
ncbi:hypothetical protein QVD17_30647 [Tagetes erecta]|uniref:Uncharacterized protein n=1 Tax=Tagetes erecta TaxID=13708 RepID=A0AAD8NNI0_TARER|nr:hypothetical protein QVD17_30647 [Tagetes erecta]